MSRSQRIGRWGEQAAAGYLETRGYTILSRNLVTPHGEIDLIARRGGLTIFVEVKARTTARFGPPEISITARKQAHLRAAVEYYLLEHPIEGDWQVDAIAVEGRPGQPPDITHFENVLN
jgi:putative endonuclease